MTLKDLAEILSDDETCVKDWCKFYDSLNLRKGRYKLGQNFLLGLITPYALFVEILQTWVSEKHTAATNEELVKVLRRNNFADVAEKVANFCESIPAIEEVTETGRVSDGGTVSIEENGLLEQKGLIATTKANVKVPNARESYFTTRKKKLIIGIGGAAFPLLIISGLLLYKYLPLNPTQPSPNDNNGLGRSLGKLGTCRNTCIFSADCEAEYGDESCRCSYLRCKLCDGPCCGSCIGDSQCSKYAGGDTNCICVDYNCVNRKEAKISNYQGFDKFAMSAMGLSTYELPKCPDCTESQQAEQTMDE